MTGYIKDSDTLPPTKSAWAWDLYWHADCLHSCVPVSNPASAKALTERWSLFFTRLPRNARIVDIGTGNGAVISIAARIEKEKATGFSLHGVDAADIDPAAHVKTAADALSRVTFHPRTRMEALPFSDGTITAVCGQYALEYGAVEGAIAEIMRVLAPEGRFQFLIHARDSMLISRSRKQLKQAEILLDSGLADDFRCTLPLVLKAETPAASDEATFSAAKNAFDAFNSHFTALQKSFRGDEDPSLPANFLEAMSQLFQSRRRYEKQAILSMLDDMVTRLSAQAQRLRDLEAAALDDNEILKTAELFRMYGFNVVKPEKAYSGESSVLLGWWLTGSRLK